MSRGSLFGLGIAALCTVWVAGATAVARGTSAVVRDDSATASASVDRADRPAGDSVPASSRPGAAGEDQGEREVATADRGWESGASDVDRRSQMQFAPAELRCPVRAPLADVSKEAVFAAWRALRSQRQPLAASEERAEGDQIHEALSSRSDSPYRGKIDRPGQEELRRYVQAIGETLLPHRERGELEYTFHIVDEGSRNAFAIPGGHIYVHSGLFSTPRALETEADLAGVIAHEIVHIDRRHTSAVYEVVRDLGLRDSPAELPMEQLMLFARQPYNSALEDEADAEAVRISFAAGYSPLRTAYLWDRWAQLDGTSRPAGNNPIATELEVLLQSHSDSDVRACNVRNEIVRRLPDQVGDAWYVGTRNLANRQPREQRTY